MEFANAYEQRSGRQLPEALVGRSAEDEDYSNIDESIEKSLRSSTIIPSHATKTQLLDGLEAERIYMVELFATVDSTEGELRGEPAVLFIRTNSTTLLNDAESVRYDVKVEKKEEETSTTKSATTLTTKVLEPSTSTISSIPSFIPKMEILTTEDEADEPTFDLDIRTPYFENGKLRTSISWIDSSACSPVKSIFAVRLTPRRCEKSDTRLLTVTQCVATIDHLNFDCEYEVEVDDVNTRKVSYFSSTHSRLILL